MRRISLILLMTFFVFSREGWAQRSFTLGKSCYDRSQFDSAYTYFSTLIDSCKKQCADSMVALYRIYRGKALHMQEEYPKAMAEFTEAIGLSEKAANDNGKAFALASLAELYRRNGKYDNARQSLDEAVKLIAKGHVDKYSEAYCYNRYAAVIHERGGDTAVVKRYLQQAMKIARKYGYDNILAMSLNELGYFEENSKRATAAIELYKQSLEIEKGINRPIYIASVECNLARIYLKQGNYPLAEQYVKQGIEVMQPINSNNTKAFLYRIYSEALYKQNKFKESHRALEEHLKYQTKLLEDYYSKSLAELEAKFELNKKNDIIDLERQKTFYAQQDADHKRTQILYAVSGTIILSALVILLLLAYRRIRKTNRELAVALEKRNDLLKEVNHRVKNNMQTVTSLLEMESDQLEGMREKQIFRNSINKIQTLALAHQNLYATDNYSSIDLGIYLDTLAQHILHEGSEYTLKLDLTKGCRIDIEKAQAVGFILNELMANSLKYAWPGKFQKEKVITLIVTEGSEEIYFHYSDNGIGMENKKPAGSMGIPLIRSFVKRQLDGALEMYNEQGAHAIIKFRKNVSL